MGTKPQQFSSSIDFVYSFFSRPTDSATSCFKGMIIQAQSCIVVCFDAIASKRQGYCFMVRVQYRIGIRAEVLLPYNITLVSIQQVTKFTSGSPTIDCLNTIGRRSTGITIRSRTNVAIFVRSKYGKARMICVTVDNLRICRSRHVAHKARSSTSSRNSRTCLSKMDIDSITICHGTGAVTASQSTSGSCRG